MPIHTRCNESSDLEKARTVEGGLCKEFVSIESISWLRAEAYSIKAAFKIAQAYVTSDCDLDLAEWLVLDLHGRF